MFATLKARYIAWKQRREPIPPVSPESIAAAKAARDLEREDLRGRLLNSGFYLGEDGIARPLFPYRGFGSVQ